MAKTITLLHRFGLSGDQVEVTRREQKNKKGLRSMEIFQAERDRIKQEKAEKERLRVALQSKPLGVKLKQDKSGKYYYQMRDEKGRMLPRVDV